MQIRDRSDLRAIAILRINHNDAVSRELVLTTSSKPSDIVKTYRFMLKLYVFSLKYVRFLQKCSNLGGHATSIHQS